MANTEKTQFTLTEALEFAKSPKPPSSASNATSEADRRRLARETYMANFAAYAAGLTQEQLARFGGIENIKRVRVLENSAGEVSYDFTLKLPLQVIERKRAEEISKKRKEAVLAKIEGLLRDPKALRKYLDEAAKGLERSVLDSVLAVCAEIAKGDRKQKEPKKHRPVRKFDPWQAAIAQDRRNRLEAAKAASTAYHRKVVRE